MYGCGADRATCGRVIREIVDLGLETGRSPPMIWYDRAFDSMREALMIMERRSWQ